MLSRKKSSLHSTPILHRKHRSTEQQVFVEKSKKNEKQYFLWEKLSIFHHSFKVVKNQKDSSTKHSIHMYYCNE